VAAHRAVAGSPREGIDWQLMPHDIAVNQSKGGR